MSVMIKESCETTDHKRPNKHFRGLWLSFKTNKMGSSFGTTVIMKKHPDNVLFHNRHSSFLERAVPLLLFGMLAQNIVAFYEHFHVWSLMSVLMPKETASISECCGWEHFVHRDVLCGLIFFFLNSFFCIWGHWYINYLHYCFKMFTSLAEVSLFECVAVTLSFSLFLQTIKIHRYKSAHISIPEWAGSANTDGSCPLLR